MNNIISCDIEQNNYYKLGILDSSGAVDTILITPDGVYTICYVDSTSGNFITTTGRILKVVYTASKLDSYIEFDDSYDNSNRKKRIYLNKIKSIKDVTPNNAYLIAVKHGFIGAEEEWLSSIKPVKGVDYFDGEKGESGVYVGSGEMPEGYNVQIDPDDDGSGGDVLSTLLTDVYNMMNDIKAIKQFIGMTD